MALTRKQFAVLEVLVAAEDRLPHRHTTGGGDGGGDGG
ncbi:hypothetical protein SNL152K_81 [Streptomyces sp. NL15-2K]|nr:hypothetical protein SNL152K_81 [Streptomyces sp. NL15-2K]